MSAIGLTPHELELMRGVFRARPEIQEVILFGSRAKGTHRPMSDVDLALTGTSDILEAARLADALDQLPLPYIFDVQPLDRITYPPLREHIERVGVVIHRREA